jgi:hypothetical protein
VSLNTAVAARVGAHRVTYQPNISGVPDPSGLQLRVDGALTTLGASGLDLGSGGRVTSISSGGIEIDFPNGTVLSVTPGWWSSQEKWYLNVDVLRTPSLEGIMGAILPGSWLPAMPNGTSLGPKPASLHQRYVDLYERFGNAWRVTDATSLFDYARGDSTAAFTLADWPRESGACEIPAQPTARPASLQIAEQACRQVTGKNRHADCVFDVRVTGNTGFAKTYLQSQRIEMGATTTTVTDDSDPSQLGEWVTFVAVVARNSTARGNVPRGSVQFLLDGTETGAPVKLDANGRAAWETSRLKVGRHLVSAAYLPGKDTGFLASRSPEEGHDVARCGCEPQARVSK